MTDTPETAPEVLKPCPFCGSANAASVMMQHPDTFAVGCVSCRGRGPWATRDDANAAWNRRTTPEAARQDVREALASELREHFPAGDKIGARLSEHMFARILAALSTSPLANETGALREAEDPDLGKIEAGHICKHGVRWPHACVPCDDASWKAHQAALASPDGEGK